MKISHRRHRIQIQKKVSIPDGMGSHTDEWVKVRNIWAAIWPVSAKERIKEGKIMVEMTHGMNVRYHSDIAFDMRVLFGQRIFGIISKINPGERNIMLDLLCKAET